MGARSAAVRRPGHRGATRHILSSECRGLPQLVLAGISVGVFSIVLIKIYGRGGQLSFVFPTIYGGAIVLAAIVGWLVLKDDVTTLRLAAVGVIVAGIGMLAVS